ncbi:nucleotidyltransferase family protein [bacterium]|nr:nucleotidyltransferase family protein [bacterium]
MDGVILAAGAGTRLRPLTNAIPKALVSVGPHPLAEHVLRGFVSAGVDRVVFVTGYLGKKVESFFGDGSRWEVSTAFVRQDEARGTAHAVGLTATEVMTNPFFIAYGDIYIHDPSNYRAFLEMHLAGDFDISVMCDEIDDPFEGAAVYVTGDRVTRIVEKPPRGASTTNLNKRGIVLADHRLFDLIDDVTPAPSGELYLTDAIALAIERGMKVGAYVCRGFSSDVGTPERLAEARAVEEQREPANDRSAS